MAEFVLVSSHHQEREFRAGTNGWPYQADLTSEIVLLLIRFLVFSLLTRQHLNPCSELLVDFGVSQCLAILLRFEYDVQLIHNPHVVISWIREGRQLEPNPLEIVNGCRSWPLIDEVPLDHKQQLVEGAEDL